MDLQKISEVPTNFFQASAKLQLLAYAFPCVTQLSSELMSPVVIGVMNHPGDFQLTGQNWSGFSIIIISGPVTRKCVRVCEVNTFEVIEMDC